MLFFRRHTRLEKTFKLLIALCFNSVFMIPKFIQPILASMPPELIRVVGNERTRQSSSDFPTDFTTDAQPLGFRRARFEIDDCNPRQDAFEVALGTLKLERIQLPMPRTKLLRVSST